MKILRNGKRHDALKLDHRLLYYNMAHVVGSVDLDAMVLAIPTANRYSGRPERKADCRVAFSYYKYN